ncbi:NAD-binding protein [Cryptosporangium phraense]|uniref:TrkA family potassium uptake protein n=1 Tax=Cryptosporangium phraense TaxID=2593070 RepID=A0A545ASR5_9ACTN|nr:NAD(P)-binding protein [Cryptosporangium phraense]TQS44291.1 TrkA family potassium uptake protein [Cryptosporangium phraense]
MPELLRTHSPIVLVGSDALATRLVEDLGRLEDIATGRTTRGDGLPPGWVTVVVEDDEGPFVAHLRRAGARILVGSGRDKAVLKAAGVGAAAVLVLLYEEDAANLHAALSGRELNGSVRLVIRMYDEKLAARVEALFRPNCSVLSSSLIAAPSFVDAALGDGQQLIEIGGRTLNAGPPDTVAGAPLVVLARPDRSEPEGTELLPDRDVPDAELVLGAPALRIVPPARRRLRMNWPGTVTGWASGRLRWALAGLCALVVVGTIVLRRSGLGMSWLDAFYNMVSTLTTGAPDGVEGSGTGVTLFVAGSMLAGVVLIALITAFAIDDLLGSRLSGALGPPVGSISGHVVVCGLGTIGVRMVEQLRASGVPVVGIDTSPDAGLARRLGVPIVRGDASDEHTLYAARAHRARSVVAATDDDTANVEVGLAVWALDQDVRIVLRLFDQDLSDRITGALPQAVSLSVSAAAAPVFLAAMLGREVKAAIGHGRRVLLVAEVPVGAGSPADGRPLRALEVSGRVRVFAQERSRGRTRVLTWSPSPDAELAAGDTVLLVATRSGLAEVLLRTGAGPSPGPAPASPPAPARSEPGVNGAPAGRRFGPGSGRLAGRWRSDRVAVPTRWSQLSVVRAILGQQEARDHNRRAGDAVEAPDEDPRGSR